MHKHFVWNFQCKGGEIHRRIQSFGKDEISTHHQRSARHGSQLGDLPTRTILSTIADYHSHRRADHDRQFSPRQNLTHEHNHGETREQIARSRVCQSDVGEGARYLCASLDASAWNRSGSRGALGRREEGKKQEKMPIRQSIITCRLMAPR